jgi:hypothetical protein
MIFSRPFGTRDVLAGNPALKRRAIFTMSLRDMRKGGTSPKVDVSGGVSGFVKETSY